MTLIDEYLEYQNKYNKKFNNKAVVFMQVGGFFEMYSTKTKGRNLEELGDILNLKYTKKNNSIDDVSTKNPYMVGFPIAAVHKYIKMLMDEGYTVVLIEQTTSPPNPKREITNIYSAGTYINDVAYPEANNLVCVYLEEEKQLDGNSIVCTGLSVVDLSTGSINIHEAYSTKQERSMALDETSRFINSYYPKEILIYNTTSQNKEELISYFEIENKIYTYQTEVDKKYTTVKYQSEIFKRSFNNNIQHPFDYLEITKNIYLRVSLALLLNYAYKHNENIISKLYKPEWFSSNNLILGNNAINQLNLIDNNDHVLKRKFKSLFDVVNHTSTAMGRRTLKQSLLSPLLDVQKLSLMYNKIDTFLKKDRYLKYETHLKSILDLERFNRKINLNIIHPYELHSYIESYKSVLVLFKLIIKDNVNIGVLEQHIKDINKFLKYIECFNLLILRKYTITDIKENIFIKGSYKDLDEIDNNINNGEETIEKLKNELTKIYMCMNEKHILKNKPVFLSIKHNSVDGYYIQVSKSKCGTIKNYKKAITIDGKELYTKDLIYKEMKSVVKITWREHKQLSDDMAVLKDKLAILANKYYLDKIKDMQTKFNSIFNNIIVLVSQIDVIKSHAKTAKLYNYTKPKIKQSDHGYLKAIQLRHPIIERIIDVEYIPHDIDLGNETKGLLIYGLNCSGKSSLMKAIGTSIVLAQAGSFVPASSFEFSPYKMLFARITGNDNIFKGLSSFALEMTELRTIFQRADQNTLIIGDEVSRGTEPISGTAIVASSIIKLSDVSASYIFASHLHQIAKLDKIKNINSLKIKHLTVEYNSKKDILIYDRLLKDGIGEEIYGLTVAKYILQNKEFITLAHEIKNDILGTKSELISDKTSAYNKGVYVYECAICGDKSSKKNILDTHHINHQKNCKKGFVKSKIHIPINSPSNLVSLCKKCHIAHHENKLEISGYVMTSDGKQLIYKKL